MLCSVVCIDVLLCMLLVMILVLRFVMFVCGLVGCISMCIV